MQTGGGGHVSDAKPSDDRIATHSNMRTVVLCRNFSSAAFVSRSLRTREIRTGQRPGAESGARERLEKLRAEVRGVAARTI